MTNFFSNVMKTVEWLKKNNKVMLTEDELEIYFHHRLQIHNEEQQKPIKILGFKYSSSNLTDNIINDNQPIIPSDKPLVEQKIGFKILQ